MATGHQASNEHVTLRPSDIVRLGEDKAESGRADCSSHAHKSRSGEAIVLLDRNPMRMTPFPSLNSGPK
jgi:hypothetical protein